LEAISGYRGGLGSTEANGRLEDWSNRHVEALLASARQLLELRDASEHIRERAIVTHGRHFADSLDALLDHAVELGWQPRKDGGNG
jgi:hypothetical protein